MRRDVLFSCWLYWSECFFSKLRAVAKAADMKRSERRTHLLDAGVVCLQRMYLLVEGSSFFSEKASRSDCFFDRL